MTADIVLQAECCLCESQKYVLTGEEPVSCPACSADEIKHEYQKINLDGVDVEALKSLMDQGWDIRDSASALRCAGGDKDSAIDIIKQRTRMAAEASELDAAALRSESSKQTKADSSVESLKHAIETSDVQHLWTDSSISRTMRTCFADIDTATAWWGAIDANEITLLSKYFTLRMKAFRWYPREVEPYFNSADRELFKSADLHGFLTKTVAELEEGLFSLGSTFFLKHVLDPDIECWVESKTLAVIDIAD